MQSAVGDREADDDEGHSHKDSLQLSFGATEKRLEEADFLHRLT